MQQPPRSFAQSVFPRRGAVACASVAVAASLCVAPRAAADEGQWMPKQIAELDQSELARLGLELTAQEVWNPDDFGLMAAIVNFGGCSSGFISPKGLIATNHHCAYGAIQAQSSVDHDYLTDGFVATTQADELEAKGKTVKVLEKITDVTEDIRVAVEAITEPAAKQRAFELAGKLLVEACEKQPNRSCRVAEFYNGSEVQLHEYLELKDVRLVYAPPSGVGNFGGEVDNWMWPRHSGDYSLLRAYVGPDGKSAPYSEDNVPYEPKRFLDVSTEGVAPGSFVAVLGYPGHTDRYLPAAEMRRQLEQFLPSRVSLYGEWIGILEEEGAREPAVKIKVAAKLRGLANRHKNARGMLEGIARDKLLERREAEEVALAAWAKEQGKDYGAVLPGLAKLAEARRSTFERDFLLDNLRGGANTLATAIDLVRRAKERGKPDLERKSTYMDRGEKRLWSRIEGRLRDYDETVDRRLLEALFRRVEALPAEAKFSGLRASDIAGYLAKTKVSERAFVRGLFDAADYSAIEASRDPMIALARDLVTATETREAQSTYREGEMLDLGPRYFEMLRAVRKGPVYPDANGTLRLTLGTVVGYAPQDGLVALPQTTASGFAAKAGAAPFDAPPHLVEAAANAS
ncbi:MAG: S46 family peptidase, partial [Myxococcota bacterium]